MDTDQSRVIVTTGATAHRRRASTIATSPRSGPTASSAKEAASHLANQLALAMDTAPDRLAPADARPGDRRRPGVRQAARLTRGRNPQHPAPLDSRGSTSMTTAETGPSPKAAEGGRAAPRARAARRHDDRHGGDDRLGHLHHLGRVGPAGRRTRLAARGLGPGRPDDGHRRALLRPSWPP